MELRDCWSTAIAGNGFVLLNDDNNDGDGADGGGVPILIVATFGTNGVAVIEAAATILERSILMTGSAEKLKAVLLPDILAILAGALKGAAAAVFRVAEAPPVMGKLL